MPPLPEQPANHEERFCSRCGKPLTPREEGGRIRAACPGCGHIVFGRFSVGVGGLLFHQRHALLVQRAHDPGKGRWTLPGGYVEEDEAPHVAIVREVLEETGLSVRPRSLMAIRHAQTPREQNLYLVFSLELDGPPEPLLPDGLEVSDARWVRPADLHALGPIGSFSEWIIRHGSLQTRGLITIPPDRQPPPVSTHRWTALYAVSSSFSRRKPMRHRKD